MAQSKTFDEIAEYRLLGAVLERPADILKLTDQLFTDDRIRIYHAMKQTYLKYGELSTEGVERVYGKELPYEIETARGTKLSAILDYLAELATRRQLTAISNNIVKTLAMGISLERQDLGELLKLKPILTKEDSGLASGINGFISDLQRKRSGKYRFVSTGIEFLDYALGGEWPRQALTVVMGGSGSGKTALICQSILQMARAGIPSLFISLEMTKPRLIQRFVANIANIDGRRLKAGDISDEEAELVNHAMRELQKLPIYIEDNPELTVDQITYLVKSHKESYGIEAFFVDYLQIVPHKLQKNDSTSEVLGDITQQLRNVAVIEDISAIALSQQNRAFKGLPSLLGSGRIGHIADSAFEIEIADTISDDLRTGKIEFHKNRDGPIASSQIFYEPRYLRFK